MSESQQKSFKISSSLRRHSRRSRRQLRSLARTWDKLSNQLTELGPDLGVEGMRATADALLTFAGDLRAQADASEQETRRQVGMLAARAVPRVAEPQAVPLDAMADRAADALQPASEVRPVAAPAT